MAAENDVEDDKHKHTGSHGLQVSRSTFLHDGTASKPHRRREVDERVGATGKVEEAARRH